MIDENNFSYYGYREYKKENETNYTYIAVWLKATYDDNGNVIETNHGTTKYETGLYDGDFMLMGTFIQSFIRRGGYWNDDFGSGVFYTNGTVGAADSTYGFRPVVIL